MQVVLVAPTVYFHCAATRKNVVRRQIGKLSLRAESENESESAQCERISHVDDKKAERVQSCFLNFYRFKSFKNVNFIAIYTSHSFKKLKLCTYS